MKKMLKWVAGVLFLLVSLGSFSDKGAYALPIALTAGLLALTILPPTSLLLSSNEKIGLKGRRLITFALLFANFLLISMEIDYEKEQAALKGFATVKDYKEAMKVNIDNPAQYATYKAEIGEKEKINNAEKVKKLEAEEQARKDKDRLAAIEEQKTKEKKRLAAENEDNSIPAFIQCKAFIKAMLKAPSSADFPFRDYKAFQQKDQTYVIKSYVDAQNEFGVKLRSNWHCKVQLVGENVHNINSWKLLDLEIL